MLTTDFAQSAQTPLPEMWLKIREIQGLIKGINDFELMSVDLFFQNEGMWEGTLSALSTKACASSALRF